MSTINKRIEQGIGYIGFNRPDKRNSLSPDLVSSFLEVSEEFDKNPEVKVILLYGEGKAFSAGGDLATMNSLNSVTDYLNYMNNASEVANKIKSLNKFVVSAVHGFAAGAGFSIALASDFVVASKDAKFISSFRNVGLIPDLGLIKNLTEKVPGNLAKQWIVSGNPITAEEAEMYGLVNQLSTDDLLKDAAKFCEFIVSSPPLANRFTKYLVNHSNQLSDESNFMIENLVQALLLQTDDSTEGINAFLEKRKPVFQGN